MGNNRIAKYLREMDQDVAKCVIVSDIRGERVVLSMHGQHLIWSWKDGGVESPGAVCSISVHPIAAESIVIDEIGEFLSMEGVEETDIAYVDTWGHELSNVYFHPNVIGEPTYNNILKKEKVRELYSRFKEQNCKISVELIGEAICFDILGAFLSLVNL